MGPICIITGFSGISWAFVEYAIFISDIWVWIPGIPFFSCPFSGYFIMINLMIDGPAFPDEPRFSECK